MPTSSSYWFLATDEVKQMSKKKGVIIGVDPHKMSVTIEVVDTREQPRHRSVRHHQHRLRRDEAVCEAVA